MTTETDVLDSLRGAVNSERLLETAVKLIDVPSPTGSAGDVAQCLAGILESDGFVVDRPDADWPEAPAVVTRLDSGGPGPTLQFNGHLDTVHLPFVPARIENGILYGSGSSDMKGGVAAMVEALRILRDTGALTAGTVLLTTHELHEAPWGDSRQCRAMIDDGTVGDAVMIPEYISDIMPVGGRGLAIFHICITRAGDPVHEVLGGIDAPSVIGAGAEVIRRFGELDVELSAVNHDMFGRESVFIGQANAGEIYNQAPTEMHIHGTRRWLPQTSSATVDAQLRDILAKVAKETDTTIDAEITPIRDAYEIDTNDPVVTAFQASCRDVMGDALPLGPKQFVDDGNMFASHGGVPAITHGPAATGAHTLNEEVPIAELERTALLYALTAVRFCSG